MPVELRQLDWWETIQPGDLYCYTSSIDVHYEIGYRFTQAVTVDTFFFACKQLGVTVLVYRPV